MKLKHNKRMMRRLSVIFLAGVFTSLFLKGFAQSTVPTEPVSTFSTDEVYDAIVVPGVPFIDSNWSATMKARVYWSKYLFDRGIAKNIIYSGSSVYSPYVEAEIMALYAEQLGIPREHIFTESFAEHSTENIYYSYKLAQKMGFKRVALTTDPFQSKMLAKFVRKKVSPDVDLIPINYDSLNAMTPAMYDPKIDYSRAYNAKFISIKEREGFFKRFRGTAGKNIDTLKYN